MTLNGMTNGGWYALSLYTPSQGIFIGGGLDSTIRFWDINNGGGILIDTISKDAMVYGLTTFDSISATTCITTSSSSTTSTTTTTDTTTSTSTTTSIVTSSTSIAANQGSQISTTTPAILNVFETFFTILYNSCYLKIPLKENRLLPVISIPDYKRIRL
jgi:WD40 repeat protein